MICIGCGEEKALHDFPVQKQNQTGRSGRCRLCTNLQQREQKARWGRDNRAKKAAWQRENVSAEQAREYRQRTYYRDLAYSREVGRRNRSQYRARIRGCEGTHTSQEWRDLCAKYGNRCAYCGSEEKMTRDHVIPLSRGGTNDISNLVPACLRCNLRKGRRLDFNPDGVDSLSCVKGSSRRGKG